LNPPPPQTFRSLCLAPSMGIRTGYRTSAQRSRSGAKMPAYVGCVRHMFRLWSSRAHWSVCNAYHHSRLRLEDIATQLYCLSSPSPPYLTRRGRSLCSTRQRSSAEIDERSNLRNVILRPVSVWHKCGVVRVYPRVANTAGRSDSKTMHRDVK
jgi:hypothetical protein